MVTTRQQLVTSTAKVNKGVNPITSITVHETANASAGANAAAHANLQTKGNVRNASWQWTVDDAEAVQSFRDDQRCWHAGTAAGNNSSLGVELCVNNGSNWALTIEHAAQLVAAKALEHGLGVDDVKQHNAWSGKNCPTRLRSGYEGITWGVFLGKVAYYMGVGVPTQPAPQPPKPPAPKPPRPNCQALQRAVRTLPDNAWGANTDKHCDALREASRWGGYDYPYGIAFTQAVCGTTPDSVWGKKSTAAHTATVRATQDALRSMGYDPGPSDGIWGDRSERAYQAARSACHI